MCKSGLIVSFSSLFLFDQKIQKGKEKNKKTPHLTKKHPFSKLKREISESVFFHFARWIG